MFLLTALAYPVVGLPLCAGAGPLVDRASGRSMPAAMLAALGVVASIELSQLSACVYALAPATPLAVCVRAPHRWVELLSEA